MPGVMRVPYVPSGWNRVKTMAELAQATEGQKTLDLGSGDGRVVIAMAQVGALAYGYEINPELIEKALENIVKAQVAKNAFILNKDYWNEDLSGFDIITIYGMTSVMKNLEKKLQKELKPGSKVISNFFTFPNWPHTIKKDGIYVYVK